MLMKPLPDIDTIFSLLTQQERQMHNPEVLDTKTPLSTVDNNSGSSLPLEAEGKAEDL